MYQIDADDVQIGPGAVIEDGVVIKGRSASAARRVVIGDNAFIGAGSRIVVDEFEIGHYSTLHNHAFIAGDLPCRIGHACWIGQHTVLNSTGGLTLGNGVGIGAYSQLWTHIKHGDVLQGCRWHSAAPTVLDDDVWLVGHCVVSPIHAGARSMALLGSVITRNMAPDRTYAGVPARDVTDRLGPQFGIVSLEEKIARLRELRDEFCRGLPRAALSALAITGDDPASVADGATWFDLERRTFVPQRTPIEVAFVRFLLARTVKIFPSL